jgi:LacI family transcriptional regulator
MKQVAEAAGLSRPTVSQILNGKGHRYSEKTRRCVLDAANALQYRPNSAARAMRLGQFGCATLLSSTLRGHSAGTGSLSDSISDELNAHGLNLMISKLPDQKLTDKGFIPKILQEVSSDGLLINYVSHIPEQMIKLIRMYNIPSVWINSKQEFDCVYPDEYRATEKVMRYLLELGHRKIAFMACACADHYSVFDRKKAYLNVIKDAGLTPEIVGGAENEHIEYADRSGVARKILQRKDRPTAIIANDTHIETMIEALALGLTLPQDLHIAAFINGNNDPLQSRITSLCEPNTIMGKKAAEMLIKRIADKTKKIVPEVLQIQIVKVIE